MDLPAQAMTSPRGHRLDVAIGDDAKEILLHGLDVIGLTLKRAEAIEHLLATARSKFSLGLSVGR